jgi:hypothetical protein
MALLTENYLDEWVRGNSRIAQGVVVELVWRLVAASSPKPKDRRFPLGDSIGQPGPDGILDVDFPLAPFVPDGLSYWEIGTGIGPATKATSDYKDLTAAVPQDVRASASFVFVTPLSGRRGWQGDWKEKSQLKWISDRKGRGDWRDVRVIDGTRLIDWLSAFPAVELWLAHILRLPTQQLETIEQRWGILKSIGEPPPMSPSVFLANRDEAQVKLSALLQGQSFQLKLDTQHPEQVVDFVAAHIASMDSEARADVAGRCVVVAGPEGWKSVVGLREAHVLVADPDLDLSGEKGTKLLELARRAGHQVIYGGLPGGVPHPNSAAIPTASPQQVEKCLRDAGYAEERARTLALKSAGNLGSLLRCLQNASLMPEWASPTASAELAVAVFLGTWNERVPGDVAFVENVSGKAYGEWIGALRELAAAPGTPLTQQDGVWKFVQRYEGWYALGPRLFDDHLKRFQDAALKVLREIDPALDLPTSERYMASVRGKVWAHSADLRSGIATTLALLGSHPGALVSCSVGRSVLTAARVVDEALSKPSSGTWASLTNLLPLLAEAAPSEFLDCLDTALLKHREPIARLFTEEGDGLFGGSYVSGLLWALETLAWEPAYLGRVTKCLGELDAMDPGGKFTNRPGNSLATILLPWFPQTCASVQRRIAVVSSLLTEMPDVAWKLLRALLPQAHATSMGSHKPQWRQLIPSDWSSGATMAEYREQITAYATLAVQAAQGNPGRLVDLIDHLPKLPPDAIATVIDALSSDPIRGLSEGDRLGLWDSLVALVNRHRRFSEADWAMSNELLARLDATIAKLAPSLPEHEYRRLFTERDFDLYERNGNWSEQAAILESKRDEAIISLLVLGPLKVIEFAATVESPWRVGVSLGRVANDIVEKVFLPAYLEPVDKTPRTLASGFVRGRFALLGWEWVDAIAFGQWNPRQLAQFFAYLPFASAAWRRVEKLLGPDSALYWAETSASPYEASADLVEAMRALLKHERPRAALRCAYVASHEHVEVPAQLLSEALLAAVRDTGEPVHAGEAYEIGKVIDSLQEAPDAKEEDIGQVEWAYLPILDREEGSRPKVLEKRLATDPNFFCEVIRLVFRSTSITDNASPPQETQEAVATNAYRLLHQWRYPPGMQGDRAFDSNAFDAWLEKVRHDCSASGHLEVAMTIVGQVLTFAPPDPSGLWILDHVARTLDGRDASDMRAGFRTQMFNARGVYGFTGGKEEQEIAAGYREKATALDEKGFSRFAATLTELSETYEREAERGMKRGPR